MSRADFPFALSAAKTTAVLCAGLALIGCQSIREATGVAKTPPDEFTVLTKAPLVLPPDYNLRPPQPGIASRGEINAEDQGRSALFPQNAADQAQALGNTYSDGEKLLLTRSGALGADPNVRRAITSDVGLEDQGPAFAQSVLYPQRAAAAAAPAQVQAQAEVQSVAAPAQARPNTPPAAESILYPQSNTATSVEAQALDAPGAEAPVNGAEVSSEPAPMPAVVQ